MRTGSDDRRRRRGVKAAVASCGAFAAAGGIFISQANAAVVTKSLMVNVPADVTCVVVHDHNGMIPAPITPGPGWRATRVSVNAGETITVDLFSATNYDKTCLGNSFLNSKQGLVPSDNLRNFWMDLN
jgi:hypothetical protein